MELEGYTINLDPKIGLILVEHPSKSVSLTKLTSYKNTVEFSTKRKYHYGIIKKSPGYYFSYRLIDRKVIVCGSFDRKDCIDRTKKFIEDENSSN